MWDANQDLNRLRVQLNIQAFPHAAQKHIVELGGWQNFQMSIRHHDCTIKSTITSNFRAVKHGAYCSMFVSKLLNVMATKIYYLKFILKVRVVSNWKLENKL